MVNSSQDLNPSYEWFFHFFLNDEKNWWFYLPLFVQLYASCHCADFLYKKEKIGLDWKRKAFGISLN